MKQLRSILFLLVLCMMTAGPVSAASSKSSQQVTQILTCVKKGNIKKARKIARKMKPYANEKCVKKMSAGMKKAYLTKLNQYLVKAEKTKTRIAPDYVNDYFLTDIDNDKKPELLIKYGSCEAVMRIYIYTYKSKKAVKVGSVGCGHGMYHAYPNHNGMILRQIYDKDIWDLITIKNGKLRIINCGEVDRMKNNRPISLIPMGLELKSHNHYNTVTNELEWDLSDLT